MSVDPAAAETAASQAATSASASASDTPAHADSGLRDAGFLAEEDLHGLARRATSRGARPWATARPSCARASCWRPAPGAARATPPNPTSRRTTCRRSAAGPRRARSASTCWSAAATRRCTPAAIAGGARSLWRLYFRSGEDREARAARVEALRALAAGGLRIWGVLPTPAEGEAEGLDTLHLIATCRLALPAIPHVIADVPALGPRLAQMALGFGADELFGPDRLGARAAPRRQRAQPGDDPQGGGDS